MSIATSGESAKPPKIRVHDNFTQHSRILAGGPDQDITTADTSSEDNGDPTTDAGATGLINSNNNSCYPVVTTTNCNTTNNMEAHLRHIVSPLSVRSTVIHTNIENHNNGNVKTPNTNHLPKIKNPTDDPIDNQTAKITLSQMTHHSPTHARFQSMPLPNDYLLYHNNNNNNNNNVNINGMVYPGMNGSVQSAPQTRRATATVGGLNNVASVLREEMEKRRTLNDSLQPILQRESTIAMSEHYKQYSFEISKFDYKISRFTLVFYDKILELYFTQFIEIKLSNLLNISMIFMCFGGLLLSAMNSSFTESRGSSIVLAILLTFMFALLSLSIWNQNKMLNDADILDKQIENELELELENENNGNGSDSDSDNNDNIDEKNNCDVNDVSNNENKNLNKKAKNGETPETEKISKCELFGKHIRSFSYFLTSLCLVVLIILQHSIAGNLTSDRFIIYYSFSIFFISEFGFIRFNLYCILVCLTWILENLGIWLRYFEILPFLDNYGGNSNKTIISNATESVNFRIQFEGHVTLFEIFFINMAVILLSILLGYVIYEKEKNHRRAFLKFLNENIQYSKPLQTYLQGQFGNVDDSPSETFPLEPDFVNGSNVTQFGESAFSQVDKYTATLSAKARANGEDPDGNDSDEEMDLHRNSSSGFIRVTGDDDGYDEDNEDDDEDGKENENTKLEEFETVLYTGTDGDRSLLVTPNGEAEADGGEGDNNNNNSKNNNGLDVTHLSTPYRSRGNTQNGTEFSPVQLDSPPSNMAIVDGINQENDKRKTRNKNKSKSKQKGAAGNNGTIPLVSPSATMTATKTQAQVYRVGSTINGMLLSPLKTIKSQNTNEEDITPLSSDAHVEVFLPPHANGVIRHHASSSHTQTTTVTSAVSPLSPGLADQEQEENEDEDSDTDTESDIDSGENEALSPENSPRKARNSNSKHKKRRKNKKKNHKQPALKINTMSISPHDTKRSVKTMNKENTSDNKEMIEKKDSSKKIDLFTPSKHNNNDTPQTGDGASISLIPKEKGKSTTKSTKSKPKSKSKRMNGKNMHRKDASSHHLKVKNFDASKYFSPSPSISPSKPKNFRLVITPSKSQTQNQIKFAYSGHPGHLRDSMTAGATSTTIMALKGGPISLVSPTQTLTQKPQHQPIPSPPPPPNIPINVCFCCVFFVVVPSLRFCYGTNKNLFCRLGVLNFG